MGYRNYEWECTDCGEVRENLIWVDHGKAPPKVEAMACVRCNVVSVPHERIISMVAEYHGERELNPVVYGGAFDTAGMAQMPTMDAMPNLPDDAGPNDVKERIDAYRDRFASPEWKDMTAQRKCIAVQNKAKQKRLAALERGENVNMRRDILPGDPKVSA